MSVAGGGGSGGSGCLGALGGGVGRLSCLVGLSCLSVRSLDGKLALGRVGPLFRERARLTRDRLLFVAGN